MAEPEKSTEQKRSFVTDKDAQNTSPVTTIMVDGKEVHLLKPEIVPTLMYGKLCAILDELKMLNATFSKASSESRTFQQPAPIQSPAANKAEPTTQSTAPLVMSPKPTEQTPRVKEILVALEPVADLLKIDTEGSSMFVMVKPASFLGPENFAKVASVIRALGGQYVSAGKNSHFEISKAPLKK
jgi:hypothetical protein